MSLRNSLPGHQQVRLIARNSFSKMVSSRQRLSTFAVLVLVFVSAAVAVPVPVPEIATEDFDSIEKSPATRSPKVPNIHEKDLGIPDDDYEDYEDDPDYLTWEDLGRMIYSWAKLFAEPHQLKHLRKCLTGNAPRDVTMLISRVESCVKIVDPDFSLKKIASLLIGS